MTHQFSPEEIDCPVCKQTFQDPKSLQCGHSVCSECCRLLNKERANLICPVCRHRSNVSADKLPVNFALRDFVQRYVDDENAKLFICARCNKKLDVESAWRCTDCRNTICSACGLQYHKGHKTKRIKTLINDKERQLLEWQDCCQSMLNKFEMSENDGIVGRLSSIATVLDCNEILSLITQMDVTTKELKQQLTNFVKRFHELNASCIIVDELHGRGDAFHSFINELSTLKQRYQANVKTENELINILNKFKFDLTRTISTYVVSNSATVEAGYNGGSQKTLIKVDDVPKPVAREWKENKISYREESNSGHSCRVIVDECLDTPVRFQISASTPIAIAVQQP